METKKRIWDLDDEDEDAGPLLSRKRSKQTVRIRGTPASTDKGKNPEPEKRKEPELKISPPKKKVEFRAGPQIVEGPGVPLTSLDGPFSDMARNLSAVKADRVVKSLVLTQVADLVGGNPDSLPPTMVANCISNPDQIREMEKWVKKQNANLADMDQLAIKLREETSELKLLLEASREEARIATG